MNNLGRSDVMLLMMMMIIIDFILMMMMWVKAIRLPVYHLYAWNSFD
jgi:hypothetical protein